MKALRALPLEERRRAPGLNPARADIVIAGGAIIETLMDELGLKVITALAECGLREGLVMDHFARDEHGHATGSVRERSVLRLAHVAGADDEHGRQVARLAVELFDSSREAGMHDLGEGPRELLGYAALLHDIGGLLSYTDHQRHSFYLIRNADLLGFDQEEIAVMAATAFFHRKGLPRARHEAFRSVDPEDRDTVKWLSLFLRIAEVLDRGHTGAVHHAALVAQRRARGRPHAPDRGRLAPRGMGPGASHGDARESAEGEAARRRRSGGGRGGRDLRAAGRGPAALRSPRSPWRGLG